MQTATVLDSFKFSIDLDFERQVFECQITYFRILDLRFPSLFSSHLLEFLKISFAKTVFKYSVHYGITAANIIRNY